MKDHSNLGSYSLPVVENIRFAKNSKINVQSKSKKFLLTVAFLMAVSGMILVISLLSGETVAAGTTNFKDLENVSYKIISEDGSIGRITNSFYQVKYDTVSVGGMVAKFPVADKESKLQWVESLIKKEQKQKEEKERNFISARNQKLLNMLGNKKRAGYVEKYSKEHKVPIYLIVGMIFAESSNRPSAVSRVGARGLMQLMPDTAVLVARKMGMKKTALKIRKNHYYLNSNEEINIKFGTYYLRDLYEKIGSWEGATHAYNQGYSRYKRGHRSSKYVRKVFKFRNS